MVLLSRFSRVQLCATPQMAAHQASLSLGFSRKNIGVGCHFLLHESEKWKWSRSVMSDSSRPLGLQPTRLLHPWDFPGKSTGVGCHCLTSISIFFRESDSNSSILCLNNIFSKSVPLLKKYHHDTYKDKMTFWQWFFWVDKHQRWWNKIQLVPHRKNPSSISMVPLFLMAPFGPPDMWGWLCLGLLSSLCSLHHSETSLLP